MEWRRHSRIAVEVEEINETVVLLDVILLNYSSYEVGGLDKFFLALEIIHWIQGALHMCETISTRDHLIRRRHK